MLGRPTTGQVAVVTTASIGTGETESPSTAMKGRRFLIAQNVHATQHLFVRFVTGVTTSNGIKVAAGTSITLEIGDQVRTFWTADGASTDLRYIEIG